MIKKLLIDTLRYYLYRLETDQCTAEEIQSFADTVSEDLDVKATTHDLAKHYGKSPQDIRNVLSRRPIPKDKVTHRKQYKFSWFQSIVPNSWKNKPLPIK